jgi:hypothetical protein
VRDGIDAATAAELEKDGVYIINFIEFHLDTVERLTTAHSDLTIDLKQGDGSQLYSAVQGELTFGRVTESQAMTVGSMQFVRSGVSQAGLAIALSEDTIDKKIKLYRGLMDTSDYTVIGDPVLIYVGRIRSFSLNESPNDTATLTWDTASSLADFNGTAGRRNNQEDQTSFLTLTQGPVPPTDLGFEFAYQLKTDVRWGTTNG